MHTQGSRTFKGILLMGCLAVLSACNQQEFYEKQFLEGVGVAEDRTPAPDITLPTDPDGGIVITNPDDGDDDQNGGGDNGDGDDGDVVVVVPPTNPDPGGDGDDEDDDDDGTVVIVDPTPGPGDNGGGDTGDNGGDEDDDDDGTVVIVDPTPGPGDNGGGDTGDNGGDEDDDDDGTVVIVDPTPNPEPEPEPEPEVILSNRIEKFIQNKAKDAPVDILWVVDDSGSMGDEQRSLAYNFEVFINEFIERKIDFKMAITTTDGSSSKAGKYRGALTTLTSEAAKNNESRFIKDFKNTIQVGTSGSGTEQGLYTAKRFLERYNTSSFQWLRKDAYLIIVQISDEEEQNKSKVSDLVSSYTSYKDNAGMVKVYTIVTTDLRGEQWETVGQRYMDAANMTNGVIADIHQDFYTVLRDMGNKIVDLLDKFALAEAPHQGVQVFVGGNKVETGYLYNNETRTIKFLEGHVPAEGSEIEVHYQVVETNTTILASGSN